MSDKKKCSSCLGEIPARAKKCQHCSSKVIMKWKYMTLPEKIATVGCGGLIGIVVVAVIFSSGSEPDPAAEAEREKGKRENAAAICAQNEVKNQLKSPSTAKFPWGLDAVLVEGDQYLVANYVDSQNSFGATIRTNYICDVTIVDAETYTCQTECVFE